MLLYAPHLPLKQRRMAVNERTSRPRRNARVLAQRADATLILLHMDSGRYYALDEVGARVWDLCDGTRPVEDIVGAIEEEYEAPRATIAADVADLLMDLEHERLVITAR